MDNHIVKIYLCRIRPIFEYLLFSWLHWLMFSDFYSVHALSLIIYIRKDEAMLAIMCDNAP